MLEQQASVRVPCWCRACCRRVVFTLKMWAAYRHGRIAPAELRLQVALLVIGLASPQLLLPLLAPSGLHYGRCVAADRTCKGGGAAMLLTSRSAAF